MGLNLNRWQVKGNLGADPELRYTPSGMAVANIRVGANRSWKSKGSDEWQEETEWVTLELWDKTAERMAEVLRKGDSVYAEGRHKTEVNEKDGQKRYFTKLVVETIFPLRRLPKAGESEAVEDRPRSVANSEAIDIDDIPF